MKFSNLFYRIIYLDAASIVLIYVCKVIVRDRSWPRIRGTYSCISILYECLILIRGCEEDRLNFSMRVKKGRISIEASLVLLAMYSCLQTIIFYYIENEGFSLAKIK